MPLCRWHSGKGQGTVTSPRARLALEASPPQYAQAPTVQRLELAQRYLLHLTNNTTTPITLNTPPSLAPIILHFYPIHILDICRFTLGFCRPAAVMSFWKKHPPRAPPVIRIERVQPKTTTATPSTSSSTTKTTTARPAVQSRLAASRPASNLTARRNATSSKETDATKSSPTKKSRKRSPAYRPVESDSSDNDTVVTTASAKRLRLSSNEVEDPDRRLRARKPLSEADSQALIHAADIASLKLGFKPCFGKDRDGDAKGKDVDVGVSLHYPGSSLKERFVWLGS